MWRGVIEEYRSSLPVGERTPVVTLLEGGTPLVPFHLEDPQHQLWVKYEATNPTGSFKDRGMTVAISRALETGAQGVICASTGNTAASAAAYAARGGLPCAVVVPAHGVALGKLVQALVHGATVIPVEAEFDEAFALASASAERFALRVVNSINPDRLAGQKTAAFEICDGLGRAPAALAIPVGNGGNISAYWQGFKEYRTLGRIDRLPQMIGVQAEGAAPLFYDRPVSHPQTIASAIRIGRPVGWTSAKRAVEESGGRFVVVSDDEILAAQTVLARAGLFVEPASAASVAGVRRLLREGIPLLDVVCVLTGHGLKDPEVVQKRSTLPRPVQATLDAIGARLSARATRTNSHPAQMGPWPADSM